MPEPAPLGVGIDLEDGGAFSHLSAAALRRAAARWLTPAERAWCSGQPSLGESLLVVLCCKEAAFKAWSGGHAAHQVSLVMQGCATSGWALVEDSPIQVRVDWRRRRGRVLALAVATDRLKGSERPPDAL